ncbi:MAG: DNA cytosine methyltransferase [Kiritimatiellae bacterium]|nr:DNA cytosine methyltransferase [Kiritimatiellia bacterium]
MTPYADSLGKTLVPKMAGAEKVIDLFAGCGGLSLGFEAAGFATEGFEMVPSAAETYRSNLIGHCETTTLEVGFDYPAADVVIGGPPCQPFSVRGKQQGMKDARDGFPIFIDAVRRIRPRVFLFENVRNLMYSHRWYLDLILDELETIGYSVECRCLNAVHYGVPQNRERLIVVGHRSSFHFPKPGNVAATVGDAIGDTIATIPEGARMLTPEQDAYIAEYERKSHCARPRDLYPDIPARTITCRNLAGATSDMQRVRLPDGRRRRLVVREAARLQSFPDWFEFCGNETQQFTQIGNAVPPLLAYNLAIAVRETLANKDGCAATTRRSERPASQLLLDI